jgi:uncharacterized protein (UPF0276 family)
MSGRNCPSIGVAYSEYVPALAASRAKLIDHVEIPFEQLLRAPEVAKIGDDVSIILHCASLSLAGDAPLPGPLCEKLAEWTRHTQTPWIGEHLAYVRADGRYLEFAEHEAVFGAAEDDLFDVGYTISPQLSEPILERVVEATARWEERLGAPILLENGPMYFAMPGSTMTQVQFLNEYSARRPDAGLLLDLSHLVITCSNLRLDPVETLMQLPLERVVEVHISGMREEDGIAWDDHTEPASPLIFALLEHLLQRARPEAVTFEYNWDSAFPTELLAQDLERARRVAEIASALQPA